MVSGQNLRHASMTQTQRVNYYTLADHGFSAHVREFLRCKREDRVGGMVKDGKWTEALTSWREWFDRYLDTGDVRNMPPSWSDSQVLPFTSVITEGDAGTGKTYSLYNFFRTTPDGAVSSYAAKGTDTFLTYSTAFPSSMRHVNTQNTLCKLFRVRFGRPAVQKLLETVKNDSELSREYAAAAGWTFTRNDARDLFATAARKLHPVVMEAFAEIGRETGIDDLRQTPPPFGKEAYADQDTYRLYLAYTGEDVPLCVSNPIMLYEEDGMVPAFWSDFRKIMTWICLFVYQPPFIRYDCPTIISSGSTTQSSAIGYPISALQLATTPLCLRDGLSTLAYRAEFFRRSHNDFEQTDLIAHRATCMTLERSLPVEDCTYSSLLMNEVHDTLIDDPAYFPSGTRLYKRHKDVRAFVDKFAKAESCVIPLKDYIFVSSNVCTLGDRRPPTKEYLSTRTEKQALSRRAWFWRQKTENVYDKNALEEYDVETPSGPWSPEKEAALTGSRQQTNGGEPQEEGDASEAEEIKNRDDDDSKDPAFMIHKASVLLTPEEHLAHRRDAQNIADFLKSGTNLASAYLNGAKVVDQTNPVIYEPAADLVLEFARPPGNWEKADPMKVIDKTSSGRIVYMCFSRTRYVPRYAPVTKEQLFTCVRYSGLKGSLAKILEMDIFTELAPTAFKCLMFERVLDCYRKRNDDAPPLLERASAAVETFLHKTKKRGEDLSSAINGLASVLSQAVSSLCHNLDKPFGLSAELDLRAEDSDLFPILRYQYGDTDLSCFNLCSMGDIKVLAGYGGGGDNDGKADAFYPPSLMYAEKNHSFDVAKVVWPAFKALYPDMYKAAVNTLLLKDVVVVESVPKYTNRVRWTRLFCTDGGRFGAMMRAGGFRAGEKLKTGAVNRLFKTPGELYLPTSFAPRGLKVPSDVIWKTDKTVIPLSSRFRLNEAEALKTKLPETLFVGAAMNPYYMSPAMTVASAQGSTNTGHVFINLDKVAASDHLVGFTRNSDTSKLHVSGIDRLPAQSAQERERREEARKRLARVIRYYHFRQ